MQRRAPGNEQSAQRKARGQGRGGLIVGIALMSLSLIAIAASVIVSAERSLTPLENGLVQLFNLAVGMLGSFLVASVSARDAASDMVRPAARSAFRRTKSLYVALGRFLNEIEARRNALRLLKDQGNLVSMDRVELALDVVKAQVTEQIQTANDAMEDWRDLVPDEVGAMEAEVLLKLPAVQAGENANG